jgi:hypothetical protein
VAQSLSEETQCKAARSHVDQQRKSARTQYPRNQQNEDWTLRRVGRPNFVIDVSLSAEAVIRFVPPCYEGTRKVLPASVCDGPCNEHGLIKKMKGLSTASEPDHFRFLLRPLGRLTRKYLKATRPSPAGSGASHFRQRILPCCTSQTSIVTILYSASQDGQLKGIGSDWLIGRKNEGAENGNVLGICRPYQIGHLVTYQISSDESGAYVP